MLSAPATNDPNAKKGFMRIRLEALSKLAEYGLPRAEVSGSNGEIKLG